jgi:hypothetical protein
MMCILVLSLPDSPAGFKSVFGRAAGKNLDVILPGKQRSQLRSLLVHNMIPLTNL